MKKSYITVTDQFCGAGGSSQGVKLISEEYGGGLEVKLALNHWDLAIETHNTNFPDTLHDCTDVSACDPRRYPSTDILITSPECTNHSLAKGQKQVTKQLELYSAGKLDPAAERSRATMWDVCRFAEFHNYNAIIVENVVDARKWVMWDAWLKAMHLLGYDHKCVFLNSMHCWPTPQSRDRMYVVFWKKGNNAPALEYMPLAYSPRIGKDVHAVQSWKNPLKKWGKYRQQYLYCCPVTGDVVEPYYHAAFNAIDWSDIGKRIGDRAKPLSPNTQKRIQYGLDKYGMEPFVFHATYGDQARGVVRSASEPAFTQTTFTSQAVAMPFIVNDQQSTGIGYRTRGLGDRFDTIPTQPHFKLIMPFVFKGEHTSLDKGYVSRISDPISTQTCRQSMGLIVPSTPLVVESRGKSLSKPSTREAGACTTMINHGIVTDDAFNAFVSYYYGTAQASHVSDPFLTASTKDRYMLVSGNKPAIEDCYYRMIKPHEVQRVMAFNDGYVVLGSGKDKVKQLGNAVTPPAMKWLVGQVVESLS